MRKRSTYRQRIQLQDPLNWVLSGLKPLTTATDEVVLLRSRNHGAITAVITGKATLEDADTLLGAFNMAEALAKLGIGADWLPEIAEAQDALRSAGNRTRFGFSGPEIEIVNTVMEVHDLQLTNPLCTIDVVAKALRMVRKDIQLKRSQPLYFPQGLAA
jgi:hypothetical protein